MGLKNKSTIPQGMLAPSGLDPTVVNPNVQATTRPYGTLLMPSPGYDSIRGGKNKFQRGRPSGGFAPMTFAEDVGGTGAAFAVEPGNTAPEAATEWLPESPDSIAGDMIISDRGASQSPGFAMELHEGYNTIPDMGDRTRGRPLSRSIAGLQNPVRMIRKDWAEDPAMTLLGCAALVLLVSIIENDLTRAYRANRGRGPASAVTAAPAAGAEVSGDVVADALDKIGNATDEAVGKIADAGQAAADKISQTASSATGGEG